MSDLPFMVRAMPIIRWVVMGCVIFFSIIVLSANAHYIALETGSVLFVDNYLVWPTETPDTAPVFALAVAVISLITVNPLFIIDFFRRGAFTSMIVTELSVLGFLSIFWIGSAAYTTSSFSTIASLCSGNPGVTNLEAGCTDIQLTMAFGWLNWIVLLAYWITLLTMAILASKNGKPVWKLSVRNNDFGYSKKSPSAAFKPMGMQSNEEFLMQKQPMTGPAPMNDMAYNAPYSNPHTAPYDPPRPGGGLGYGYPSAVQV